MEKKNFNEMLYSLPLDIKILIFQMAVYTNIIEWGGKEHKKNFKKTVAFINPNEYNSKTDRLEEAWHYTFTSYTISHRRFDDYGNKFLGIVNHFGAVRIDVVVGLRNTISII